MAKREIRNVFSAVQHPGISTGTESLTKQSHKAECDINNIMARYRKTGILPAMIRENPQFGDYSSPQTFHEAMEVVAKATQQFEALPSQLRDRWGNNPAVFLEYASDPKNREEMAEMGLLKPEAVKAIKDKKQALVSKKEDVPVSAPTEPEKAPKK